MNIKNRFSVIFKEYDSASNKATDYFIRYLEARRVGNKRLAIYIDSKILPILRKKSYQLALLLNEEALKNGHEEQGSGQTN
jgi:sensor domain CHASE-containing protein